MLHVSISSKEGFPETLQQTSLKCNGQSCARGQRPINQWHRNGPQQSGKTNWDAPPGGDPRREGEGGGLNRSEFF